VLGIDASLRSTGFAVVEAAGSRLIAVEHGLIRSKPETLLSETLVRLGQGIADVVTRMQPAAVAIEGGFFHKNAKTATSLGEARGALIAACAALNLPIYEYAPRRVKQAIVGFGAASKEQVSHMVMSMLALKEAPPEDAADALAVAICHLHNRSGHAALMPKPI
jgi:crossover junction endodeoxyribonuclease RuvC